ncbi:hypothetical protein PR048_033129 [Dryococelus australis]|uniref:Phosphonopyruvate decarboxylase n=1 Tax=Dryococelus australis TaxID=614101 RepID=A0ABQ9FZD7_9NEOP|nr:hypothetical protein PR048_033129 [Dryococelus australis]
MCGSRDLSDIFLLLLLEYVTVPYLASSPQQTVQRQASHGPAMAAYVSLFIALRSSVRSTSPLLRMMATWAEETSPHEMQIHEQAKRNEESAHLTELIRDFLNPSEFYQALRNIDIEFFCGIPDSLLKDFCAFVSHHVPETHHVITANEGNAIGLATGYHLASGKTGLVYLQNSGLGNTVNPLLSLAAPEVYSIPMLLMIGWRGEPGKRDEPQHMLQGQVTPGMLRRRKRLLLPPPSKGATLSRLHSAAKPRGNKLRPSDNWRDLTSQSPPLPCSQPPSPAVNIPLSSPSSQAKKQDSLGIPFSTLPDFIDGAKVTLEKAKKYMDRHSCPYALLVKRQTFLPYKLPKETPQFSMSRERAVQGLINGLTDRDIVVSTTGMLSRELFEHRVAREQGHERDFLTVGSMGHASSIALGIALIKPSRQALMVLSKKSRDLQQQPVDSTTHDKRLLPLPTRSSSGFNHHQLPEALQHQKPALLESTLSLLILLVQHPPLLVVPGSDNRLGIYNSYFGSSAATEWSKKYSTSLYGNSSASITQATAGSSRPASTPEPRKPVCEYSDQSPVMYRTRCRIHQPASLATATLLALPFLPSFTAFMLKELPLLGRHCVFCIDGDGAVIMHMGTMSTVGQVHPPNFKHIVINNGAHDSVGGQNTAAGDHNRFSLAHVAIGSGYLQCISSSGCRYKLGAPQSSRPLVGELEVLSRMGHLPATTGGYHHGMAIHVLLVQDSAKTISAGVHLYDEVPLPLGSVELLYILEADFQRFEGGVVFGAPPPPGFLL